MLNIVKWNNDSYQIIFEGTSFYYSKKLPIAFRLPKDKRIFIRGEQFGKITQDYISQLHLLSRAVTRPVEEFKEIIQTAYKEAMFSGVRRIAMERMNINKKEQIDVSDQENDDRIS